jgi:cbb3-type cytochrome oxidase maturation protein
LRFLIVTIPVSLLLAASLLAIVIHAVRRGAFDDWEGPAHRVVLDDDRVPEREGPGDGEDGGPLGPGSA